MSVKTQALKAEDNFRNSFLADDDKLGDQVIASITIDGKEFSAMGDSEEVAIENLRDSIKAHYDARNHVAQLEINKAIGLHFFE